VPLRPVVPAAAVVVVVLLAAACAGPSGPVDPPIAEVKLVEQTHFDGHLKLLVPEHFTPLDETALHARFHFDFASVVALENADATIEVVALLQKQPADSGDKRFNVPRERLLRLVGDGVKKSYVAKRCLRDEVVTRDGRPIYYFELASALRERDRHVICAYTFLGDSPLEVVFTCPEARAGEWAPLGQQIVASVSVKE
jgi:hypothetical protein